MYKILEVASFAADQTQDENNLDIYLKMYKETRAFPEML